MSIFAAIMLSTPAMFGLAEFEPPLALVAEYVQRDSPSRAARLRVAWRPSTGEWSLVNAVSAFRAERDGSVYVRSLVPKGTWVRLSDAAVAPIRWQESGLVFAEFPFQSPAWRFGSPAPGTTITIPADGLQLGRSAGDTAGADISRRFPQFANATATLTLDDKGLPIQLRFIDSAGTVQGDKPLGPWQPVTGLVGAVYHVQSKFEWHDLASATAVTQNPDDLFTVKGLNRYLAQEDLRRNPPLTPASATSADGQALPPAPGLHAGSSPAETWRFALIFAGIAAILVGGIAWFRRATAG